VFGQQFIISALEKHTGKCVFSNLEGNKTCGTGLVLTQGLQCG